MLSFHFRNQDPRGSSELAVATTTRDNDQHMENATMGCLKGKDAAKPAKADYKCEKCGAHAKKKGKLCKPKKVKSK